MSFSKGPGDLRAPFGKNEYRRSDRDLKYESYTVSCESVDTEVIDGTPLKVCQSGEGMAKITSGPHKGKIGPFQAAGADEVQRLAKSGTVTSGGFKLSHPDLDGETDEFFANSNAAAVQAVVDEWLQGQLDEDGDQLIITVTGGPLTTTPLDFAWQDDKGADRAPLEVEVSTAIVGGGTVAITTTTPGGEGATDGRGDTANIVGILDTFLPWELNYRDHHSAVCCEGTVVQGWCFERDASGARIPLTDATRDAMVGLPRLALLFK